MIGLRTAVAMCANLLSLTAVAAQEVPRNADVAITAVPAIFDADDAPGAAFWFLSPFRSHHQLLLDQEHLQSARDLHLRSLTLRRNGGETSNADSGNLWVEIRISHSANSVDQLSSRFDDNRGSDELVVFDGPIHLSEAAAMNGKVSNWFGSDAVNIPFDLPFFYQGGTLCIETWTRPLADSTGNYQLPWWPIDALVEQHSGVAEPIGQSCITDLLGIPASVEVGSLVAGSTANFYFRGNRRLGLSFCIISDNDQTAFGLSLPITIQLQGLPCTLYIEPQTLVVVQPEILSGPRLDRVIATAKVQLPMDLTMIGREFFGQWLVREPGVFPRFALSNAVKATIDSSPSFSGAGWIESMDLAAKVGTPLPGRVPVLRFSH